MRNKLVFCLIVIAVAVVIVGYALWPEGRDAAVQHHRSTMELAWQRYAAEPDVREHLNAFVHHRDELVRLGHLQRRTYQKRKTGQVQLLD